MGRTFPEVLPLLIPICSERVTLADSGNHDSRIIDITDVISDPRNPLADFGESLTIDFTRAWVLAWSVRIDLVSMIGFVGNNRTNLFLTILNFTRGQALSDASQDRVRLYIPDNAIARYVYTGSRVVHSKQARVNIINQTGDEVIFDLDVWAKAW